MLGIVIYKSYFVKKSLSLETPTPTIEPQSLYKKYINTNLGYELTIPNNLSYEEKMEGKFVTLGNKIIIYLLDSDPEKCSEDCPVIDSKKDVIVNDLKARYLECHWEYDDVNTPQSFVNYIFELKDKYLVIQLQEVDFNLPVNINNQSSKISNEELEQFNKIVASLVLSQ